MILAENPAGSSGGDLGVPDALTFLLGRWRLDRRLTDHRAGISGRFTGTAEFMPAPADGTGAARAAGLTYRESGQLRFGDYAGPARRFLQFVRQADGAADVRFADGRPFYRLDLRTGHWQARHDCGPDRYLVTFRVLGDVLLTEHWRVSGPDKHYDSHTELHRAPG